MHAVSRRYTGGATGAAPMFSLWQKEGDEDMEEMAIKVYGKEGCGRCTAAKDKLKMMGFKYEEHDLRYHTALHDNWRNDGSIELLAAHAEDDSLPLIRIGEKFHDYAGAMKALKELARERKAVAVSN